MPIVLAALIAVIVFGLQGEVPPPSSGTSTEASPSPTLLETPRGAAPGHSPGQPVSVATAAPETGVPEAEVGADTPGPADHDVPDVTTTPTGNVDPGTATPPAHGESSEPAPSRGDAGAVYVAVHGSDAWDGSLNRPFRTLQHAADVAPSGSVVHVRGGVYAGFKVVRSGLTFTAYQGEAPVVRDSTRSDVIEFEGVTSGTLRGLVVEGSTTQYGSGIKVDESSGVSVHDATVRANKTFGIVVVRSSGVVIEGNVITGNAAGIEERYAEDLVIRNNRIHGNTAPVDGGRGAQGINLYKSTGRVTIAGNQLWNNGTHFEVYGASNLHISDNVTWDGQIMETGTDGPPCDGITFVRNVGYRGKGFKDSTNGIILRCASNSLFAHNTLDGFDKFAIDVVDGTTGVAYGGSIAGLRILNNIAVGGRAFSIDSPLPASVVIDHNLVYNVGSTAGYGQYLAYVKWHGNVKTHEEFQTVTGYQTNGVFGDPRFLDGPARDYRLRTDSPAVDRGAKVLASGFNGSAPDIGRFESK